MFAVARIKMTAAVMALCAPLFVGAAEPADPPVPYEIDLKKPQDRVTVKGDAKSVEFAATCPSGIGQAVIRRKADTWPKEVSLRLNLRGLEQISISNGRETLKGEVLSHSGNRRLLAVIVDGKATKVEQGSPWFTEIKALTPDGKPAAKIPLKSGYFQLTVPKVLLQKNPPVLTIRWIDFYRT